MRFALSSLLFVLGAAAAQGSAHVTPAEPAGAPPDIAPQPVDEMYFGTKVTDRFRFLEAKAPTTIAWMEAQGTFTRSVFDSIEPRDAYRRRISALGAAYGVVRSVQLGGESLFYLERKPASDVFDLVMRAADGSTRTLVDCAALIKAAGGVPQAIDYFRVSRDGRRVAVGLSSAGSEDSALSVLDVATARTIAGPIDRAQFGMPSWLDGAAGLFFERRQELQPGAPPSAKYQNYSTSFWDLKGPLRPVAGATSGVGPVTDPDEFASVLVVPGTDLAVLIARHGVRNEVKAWIASLDDARTGRAQWRAIVTQSDAVTALTADGTTLYLLTHKDAPNFKVLAMPLNGTLSAARTLIAARADRVIQSIHAAADGLYVGARDGLAGRLLLVTHAGTVTELSLPFSGIVADVAADPAKVGALIELEGWMHPTAHFHFDPTKKVFTDVGIDSGPKPDTNRYSVAEISARAGDGIEVPLSVITAAGPVTPRPTLLDGYGAYGISILPYFSPRIPAFIDAGGTYAECHVRGGGELGEAWRLGGKDANKPNTWRDLIACAQTLIAKGYTTRDMLIIEGGSAGGITVGRAATERPELFAGAISRVGDSDSLRSEVMPSGPANIPEFGTFKDPQGFKNLYAMDAYQHVRNEVKYPAFLLTTGLNDPRVEPWESAKMAARLLEVPGHASVLLRIENAAGHGFGTTKSTRDAEEADLVAFVFWRAGQPEWQPKK
jgi:prolyl oligopeptidase